jgi:hypothetical protein
MSYSREQTKMIQANKTLVGAVALALSGVASASSCDQILSWYNSDPVTYAYYRDYHPECFAGSSTTSTTQINGTSFTQASAISQALTARIRQNTPGPVMKAESGITGLAAGGKADTWNVWASYSANNSSVRVNNGANRNDTDIGTTVLGGDYALAPNMNIGVSAAFDRSKGSNLTGNTNSNHGYTIAPYFGMQLNKDWAVDLTAGMGSGKFSTGGTTSEADRLFAAGNLSYARWTGNWQWSGKFGLLHGEEKYGGVAGTKNKLDQYRLGAQAGYWMNGVMPYAGFGYTADMRRTGGVGGVDPLGRSAFVLDLGVNFISLANKMTGGIAYQQEHGRTNSKNETFMANINLRF